MGWIEVTKGVKQFILRRNSLDRSLALRGFRLRFSSDVQNLYRAIAKYATGFIDGPVELVSEKKLRKPIPAMKFIDTAGPNKDRAQWF